MRVSIFLRLTTTKVAQAVTYFGAFPFRKLTLVPGDNWWCEGPPQPPSSMLLSGLAQTTDTTIAPDIGFAADEAG